jgi:hypothetical protein
MDTPLKVGDYVRMKEWGDGTPYKIKRMDETGLWLEGADTEYQYLFSYCPVDQWKVYYHVDSYPKLYCKEAEIEKAMARVREKHRNRLNPPAAEGIYRMIRIGEE